MKNKFLLPVAIILAIAFSSCSTAYRTGQTPDDVYFSKGQDKEYARVETREDRYRGNDEYYYDQDRISDAEMARMRMRMRDYRWRQMDYYDDYYFSSRRSMYFDPYVSIGYYSPYYPGFYSYRSMYSPYAYGYRYGMYNPYYSPYYSPYAGVPVYGKPYSVAPATNAAPRRTNLNAYRETYNNSNNRNDQPVRRQIRVNRANDNYNYGNTTPQRRVQSDESNRTYTPSNNNNSNRTYNPSPAPSSTPRNSGGAVSRPIRGN